MVKKVGQRKFLLKCGYTDEQLDHMSPSTAHDIISNIEKARREAREARRKEMEDTIVISKTEYEALVGELNAFTYKYDKLLDDYRLCKAANEVIKQNFVIAQKEAGQETAHKLINEFATMLIALKAGQVFTHQIDKSAISQGGYLFMLNGIKKLAEDFGVVIKE